MVQTFLMKLARTRNNSTVPQPRKASHPIIAARTIATSNPTTAFLILRAEADRALFCGSGTRTGLRLFIRNYTILSYDE